MQNVAAASNKRSMKNDQNPATAHHTIMTARRPDNIRSSILVRGRSIRSMARSGRQPQRQLPRKDSHFRHFGGSFPPKCTVLVIQQIPTNCIQANYENLRVLPHIIFYLSTRRPQFIGNPDHARGWSLKGQERKEKNLNCTPSKSRPHGPILLLSVFSSVQL